MEQGVDKVIYTSSIVAVGYEESGKLANEETKFNMWKGNNYARTKHLGELEARKFCEQGLPLVIVNPAVVLGVRDIKPTPSGEMVVSVLNEKMPGYLDGGMNFVDVEDVARGHILAAQKGKIGERYILGNANMTLKEFFDSVADVGGVPAPKRKISFPVAMTLVYLMKLVSMINRKPPMLAESSVRFTGNYLYYDCSKAINELGMPQTPIRTTFEKAVNWFRDNGYVKS
jgi:dihydroflavonol-4-reductase